MLKVRKNIKLNQPTLQTAQEEISKSLGITITIEPNWDSFIKSVNEADKAFIGTYVARYAVGIKEAIQKFDDIAKKFFIQVVTQDKIIIKTNTENKNKFEFAFEDGVLVMNCKPETVSFSVERFDKLILDQLDEVCGVKMYQSLHRYKPVYEESVKAIQNAIGKDDFMFEVDDRSFRDFATKKDLTCLGLHLYEKLAKGIAKDVVNLCKDEDAKEAFLDTVKKIILVADKGNKNKHEFEIKDGAFRVKVHPDRISFSWETGSASKWLFNNL